MLRGEVVATPERALPYAAVVRADATVVRSEPAQTRAEGEQLLRRLIQQGLADAAESEVAAGGDKRSLRRRVGRWR